MDRRRGADSRLGVGGRRARLGGVKGTVHLEVLQSDEVLPAVTTDKQLRLMQFRTTNAAVGSRCLFSRRWNGRQCCRHGRQGGIHFQTLTPRLLRRRRTDRLHPGRDCRLASGR